MLSVVDSKYPFPVMPFEELYILTIALSEVGKYDLFKARQKVLPGGTDLTIKIAFSFYTRILIY